MLQKKDFFLIKGKETNYIYHAPSFRIAELPSETKILKFDDNLLYKTHKDIEIDKRTEKVLTSRVPIRLVFMSARTCNLCCGYCFADGGQYGDANRKPQYMTYATYMKAIEYFTSKGSAWISSISFFGGEPLLNWDQIKEFIPNCLNYFEQNDREMPEIDISTNATTITAEMAEYFKRYNIKIALSVDGPKNLNDMARKFKVRNASTYRASLYGIKLLEDYGVEYHIQMVIHKGHIENYKKGMGIEWIQQFEKTKCKSIVIAPVSTKNKKYEITGDKLLKNLDCFVRDIVNYYFDKLLVENTEIRCTEMILPVVSILKKEYRKDCNAGINVIVDTDGNVYPCQMFCGNNQYLIGNIWESKMYTDKVREVLSATRKKSRACQVCIAKELCAVWCKGIQNSVNGDLYTVYKSRCVFQRAMLEECIIRLNEVNKTSLYSVFCNNISRIFGKKD